MAVRQFVAKQLAAAAVTVANDKSKEKTAAAVKDVRRRLARWISPDKPVSMVKVSVIG